MRVVQWAQEHGEVGGVRRSVHDLTDGLRAAGVEVSYLDTGSLSRAVRGIPALRGRHTLHLFHITRLWRAIVLAPVFAVLPGSPVLVLHSGSSLRQVEMQRPWQARLLRRSLTAYVRIWAVNDEIGSVLPSRVATRVRVMSPFVPTGPTAHASGGAASGGAASGGAASGGAASGGAASGGAASDDPGVPVPETHLVSVATNAGLKHYNADLAVDSIRLVRAEWPDARLCILGYGADGPHMAALRARVAAEPWVEVSFDLTPGQVTQVLARSEVFLRPTDWDGDSLIVREALAVGARVVASDVCPRPAGVELALLDAASVAQVVLRGGPVSSGEGLAGRSILDYALEAVERLRTGEDGDED